MNILAESLSLKQYCIAIKITPLSLIMCRPARCVHCGKSGLWGHGHYERKSDRHGQGELSLNSIAILRFFCNACSRTCSVLPECLARRRWYPWEDQERVLRASLNGQSIRSISQTMGPAQSTCRRWIGWIKDRYLLYRSILVTHLCELGREIAEGPFWAACWQKFSLAKAMRICQYSVEVVP